MADAGHEETEKLLKKLEKEISKEYAQAEKEMTAKLEDYMRRFKIKDELKRKAMENGLITEAEYKKWRVGQIAVGQRWSEMKDSLATDLTNTAQIAKSTAFGYMPDVYAINHNYGTYQVEKVSGVDTSYTLYDRHTAQRLFDESKTLYKAAGRKLTKKINEGKQKAWDRRQIQSVMMQGLLQGESIPHLASRLMKTVGETDRKAAIRNARTMTTGVQNGGRVDSYKRAQNMGIDLRQEWLATLDGRTRHEHRVLDGQRVNVGDKFKVDGMEIEYPGDPTAPARLIYNCRCTLVPALKGFEVNSKDLSLRNTNHMEELTYDEWKANHPSHSDPITKQDEIAETMKRVYNNEYRSYNGSNGIYREENRKGRTVDEDTLVSSIIETKEYEKKFMLLEEDEEIRKIMVDEARTTLRRRSGTNFEDLIYINSKNSDDVRAQRHMNVYRRVDATKKMMEMITENEPRTIISIHNHAGNNYPSKSDLKEAKKYKYGVIISHNGDVYKYTVREDVNLKLADMLMNDLQRNKGNKKIYNDLLGRLEKAGVKFEVF